MTTQQDLPELDIAIVGGGVSGIYTGYRVLTCDTSHSAMLTAWKKARGGKLKVRIYEGSHRTGGRLLSAIPPGMPNTIVEIGGMRYVSSQTLVRSLVENDLKLPRHEQVIDQPKNLAYVRGVRLRFEDLTDPSKLPYALTDAEADWIAEGNDPSGLIGWALEQIFPEVATLSGKQLEDFLRQATLDGEPVYQQGFWNIISRALSFEGYQLCRTAVGYDSLGSNANAVDMTGEYFNFTPGVKFYLLDQGYDAVPWTLEKRFKEHGGELELGHWLEAFDEHTLADGSKGVKLEFKDGSTVVARTVVLAMPRRAIEKLRPTGPVLDPVRAPGVQIMLNSVEPVALYKMFIAYPFPWWELRGVSQGRSLTDIPVRQCYYWAVEGRLGGDATNTNSTLMVYNDVSSVEFWGGLRRVPLGPEDAVDSKGLGTSIKLHLGKPSKVFQRKQMPHAEGEDTAFASDEFRRRLRRNWDTHEAPDAMVKEMHRQLMELHGVRYAPEPFEAAFMDWSDAPFGGGVHFWNPGYKSDVILEAMTQPVPDFPCHVCGEAWSTNQTWVEGALQTAEIVLQKRFGMAPPPWVTP